MKSTTAAIIERKDRAAPLRAKHAAAIVGKQYRFISTGEIADALEDEGFKLVEQRYSTRDHSAYAAHLFALEHPRMPVVKDIKPRVYVYGSHNGRVPLRVMGGWFRLLCSNGLIIGDKVSDFRIYHRGNAAMMDQVIARVKQVVGSMDELIEKRNKLTKISMTKAQQLEFAKVALTARFPNSATSYELEDLLVPLREEDTGNSAWLVYNRVQEHLLKGGIVGRGVSNRPVQMMPVTSSYVDVSFNTRLWDTLLTMTQ